MEEVIKHRHTIIVSCMYACNVCCNHGNNENYAIDNTMERYFQEKRSTQREKDEKHVQQHYSVLHKIKWNRVILTEVWDNFFYPNVSLIVCLFWYRPTSYNPLILQPRKQRYCYIKPIECLCPYSVSLPVRTGRQLPVVGHGLSSGKQCHPLGVLHQVPTLR